MKTIWLTGLPASGKTTLGKLLYNYLSSINGNKVEWFDGDIVRRTFYPELGFTKEERFENVKRISHLAKILNKHGIFVIVSAIAPYKEMRKMAKEIIGNYIEIYLKCPIEVCKKRDPKGHYKKAEKGEIKNFTGISDVYEEPKRPDVVVETGFFDPLECINKIVEKILSV
ncbi:MAG: adenylyl-sulfate kinase [Candidatus Desulfofervidaceae bacterium]|nr:adenylyl-sulfate kinase [Candidatus Desulfofervidaceae bacterium]